MTVNSKHATLNIENEKKEGKFKNKKTRENILFEACEIYEIRRKTLVAKEAL